MNILVVDDSAFMRKIITDIIEKLPDHRVCQQARNGQQALAILETMTPDLILLDIEMPVLNGLETLKKIRPQSTVPIIMFSAVNDQKTTIEALALGACDFVEKPYDILNINSEWLTDFYRKITIVGKKKAKRPLVISQNKAWPQNIRAVVIGASTGGPKALLKIIKALPDQLNLPIFIVQHMPKGFTASFAERLNEETKVTVCEAENGMPIKNQVYLCPGDFHMRVKAHTIHLDQAPRWHGTRPAVDPLFISAAQVYQENLVAIVLTGMGKDGTKGCQVVQSYGGYTIVQDEPSCVVFGMPHQVIQVGACDRVCSLDTICQKVSQMVDE